MWILSANTWNDLSPQSSPLIGRVNHSQSWLVYCCFTHRGTWKTGKSMAHGQQDASNRLNRFHHETSGSSQLPYCQNLHQTKISNKTGNSVQQKVVLLERTNQNDAAEKCCKMMLQPLLRRFVTSLTLKDKARNVQKRGPSSSISSIIGGSQRP